jgi:Cu(I)/Ag(I) efflux system membrane fusion protein
MNNVKTLIAGTLLGAVITAAGFSLWPKAPTTGEQAASAEKKPLYWVAPMDANYRRDKPGQSPMGMDLVPVYAGGDSGGGVGPGTITISPEVVNNLGVRTATVKREALRSEIKTVGYVRYDEDQLVHIHPRVEGWIEKLYVNAAGDPVEKGQPLYDIYSPALVNAQEELALAISRKNKRLIQAGQDRLKALQMPERAIAQLMKTKKVQQFITLYAPQTGVVDNLNIREGFFVKPGTLLMSVGTLKQVWVEAEVFERQAFQVAKGQTVIMSLDFLPGKEWHGAVDYVYPTLNAKTRTVKVRLRFDNPKRELKPNMFAQVVIYAQSDDSSLLVPKEAVIRTGSADRVVLALGEGRFKSIDVKLGRFDAQFVEVLSGLQSGEKIVTSAQFLLDSESSKSSDFKRMNHPVEEQTQVSSAWAMATINSLMSGHRMINISHEPVSEWDWPEMTMDFDVAQSVDFSQLVQGQRLRVEMQKLDNGSYQVIDIDIPELTTVDGVVNSVMADHRMLNISRGPIEKWGRPAATMDFMVAHSVDMTGLYKGMIISFSFTIENGDFVISAIEHKEQSND